MISLIGCPTTITMSPWVLFPGPVQINVVTCLVRASSQSGNPHGTEKFDGPDCGCNMDWTIIATVVFRVILYDDRKGKR